MTNKVLNAVEILQKKFEPSEQGARTLQMTDDRQTDGRAIAYSEREREFTFGKM